jgi:hypothetical protein
MKPPDSSSLVKRLEDLPSNEYPQTALALVRFYLKKAYYTKDNVSDISHQLREKAEQLLEEVHTKTIQGRESIFDQLHMDWPRTLWQKIHYLARKGISEPREEWITEIADVYKKVRTLTIWVLQEYLCKHESERGLSVSSDWLIVWLTSNVLLSPHLAGHYGLEGATDDQKPIASPVEKMEYFAHLSHLVLYALHCTRHFHRENKLQKELNEPVIVQRLPFADVPEDFSLGLSRSQLYILSEYAYHEIGVHRELGLFERLIRQLRYELPLYAASEFYRDHLFHVIDVCLLGELLLRSQVPPHTAGASSEDLLDLFRKGTGCESSRLLMQNWYIAALCHDLGYVVERTGSLLEPVHTINGPGLDQFWKAVEDGVKRGDKSIKKITISKLSDSPNHSVTKDDVKGVSATDHGVAAWLHLNHWLDQVKNPSKESSQEITPALNAILRHNLPEQRVSCRQEPLTLLLMLCDHLQEWGRPRVGPDPLSRGIMEALRFSTQAEFERKVRVKRLIIKGLKIVPTKNNSVQTRIEPDGLKFKLSHVESREGDFEPVISWLFLCRDLQCFGNQDGELPINIEIILEHTPSRIWHMMPWKPLEMDLVQEFASGYEPATYLCEWIRKAHYGEDGIHYKGYRDTGVETFTIHLNKLGRPLQRGLSDEHWKQFFKWKWRRLGQQFIGLSLGAWFPEL